jgi:spermidine synthase
MKNQENGFFLEKTKHNRIIYINAFVIGGLIMALEMVGSRFLTPFFGNSVFTWASIISMVLLALAIGYFIGGSLAEKKPQVLSIAYIVLSAAFFTLIIPLYFENLFKFIYKHISDLRLAGFLGALSILFLPLSLLGIYSPYSVKLGMKYSDSPGKVSGSIYAISTIGSIVGTLGVTFFLIPNIGSKAIAESLSFIAFLSAFSLILLHFKSKNNAQKKAPIILLLTLYLTFFIIVVFSPEIKSLSGIKQKKNKYIIEETESNYNHIIIKQKAEYISMSFSRFKSKYTESKINIFNEDELPVSYTQTMPVSLAYTKNPKKLLMIGLGGGMITKYIHKYMPQINITGVELDEKVLLMAKKYFKLKEDSNYKVFIKDGRLFLNETKATYDIIMVDAYKGGYIPFHLCTYEFYSLLEKHLSDQGVISLNLHSGSKLYPRIINTLKYVFTNVDLYKSRASSNIIAIAYNAEGITTDTLLKNAESLQKNYQFYYDIAELLKLKTSLPSLNKQKILTDDFAPINYLNAIEMHNKRAGDL